MRNKTQKNKKKYKYYKKSRKYKMSKKYLKGGGNIELLGLELQTINNQLDLDGYMNHFLDRVLLSIPKILGCSIKIYIPRSITRTELF
jgi:hypothetical protein